MRGIAEKFGRDILQRADIEVNGTRDFDITIHDTRVFTRVFLYGSLGFGEAYMDGWWDAKALDKTICRLAQLEAKRSLRFSPTALMHALHARILNEQSKRRAFIVGEEHYDVGNDLYERMLDKRMVYTCGYWSGTPQAENLDEAQEAKLDLICRKLGLKKGDHVLDIGCGWGSFLEFAATQYGVSGVGVTVSKEQKALAEKRLEGLPIEIQLKDYRDIEGRFDHVISIGMFEHVGYKNYRTYMEVANRVLKDGGLFLLHTIGSSKTVHTSDPWLNRYIFPNGMLPSIAQIGTSIETLFVMEDWHNYGADYDKTLMAWFNNFDTRWDEIRDSYDERFYKMWKFYLLSCAGMFRARKNIELWQIVLSKTGVPGGYTSVR